MASPMRGLAGIPRYTGIKKRVLSTKAFNVAGACRPEDFRRQSTAMRQMRAHAVSNEFGIDPAAIDEGRAPAALKGEPDGIESMRRGDPPVLN